MPNPAGTSPQESTNQFDIMDFAPLLLQLGGMTGGAPLGLLGGVLLKSLLGGKDSGGMDAEKESMPEDKNAQAPAPAQPAAVSTAPVPQVSMQPLPSLPPSVPGDPIGAAAVTDPRQQALLRSMGGGLGGF